MKSVMINRTDLECGIPNKVLELLPYRITDAIGKKINHGICEEIRLRRGRVSTLTVEGGNTVSLEVYLSQDEIDTVFDRLCSGSVYAHGDTIKKGYISLGGGLRAGICGSASMDKGAVIGIGEISSICIRIPHVSKVSAERICALLSEFNYSRGVLVYSPSGEGKTTLLRSAINELSSVDKGLRVAVVDTRKELEFGIDYKNNAADILSGYPKDEGIEIAMRTLNANIIVCDEIGNENEARAICDAANGGAALLASAHASDISGLMSRKSIRFLHDSGVFGAYVGIKRYGNEFDYSVTLASEVINDL